MNELVSIITPSYDCEKYIRETINSVLNQTYLTWEMLIVDDCSTDSTISIINSYNDDRIRLIINDSNLGAAISRNKALRDAKGKWIAFLDSDDIWNQKKLEKQIKFMHSNNYHFSYTNYNKVDEKTNIIGTKITGPKVIDERKMKNYCYPGCLTVMYDSQFVGLVQIENLKKNNDYALWLKIIKTTNCYLLDDILSSYRIRTGSISNHNFTKLIKYHYYLWKNGEQYNAFSSTLLTFRNLFFGVLKKLIYEK